MQRQPLLAALDLGSNSFRLQIARVENDQLYMLDSLRESVRLAAGLSEDRMLDKAAQQRALVCLHRFGERLRGLPREAVRAIGTNSLRVAKNAPEFLQHAEAALGFPIDVIAGREEARLIYLGVAHGLPPSSANRLVMDIGGGSTEFIIGNGLHADKLESLYMGCVSYSLRYFPDGKISKSNLREAELAALNELQTISGKFSKAHWHNALGSSGTAKAICEALELNGFSQRGITKVGLERLRTHLLKAGDVTNLNLQGLRADRLPVLPGGLAIMYAAFCELGIEHMQPALGALREGVLYDLLGRFHHHDMRDVTVTQFMRRYHVDVRQAEQVSHLAVKMAKQLLLKQTSFDFLHCLRQAAQLHEIGISVAHSGYHKHTAYILANADMPGFTKQEQSRLSLITLAHRGRLEKMHGLLNTPELLVQVMVLRLATLIFRNRKEIKLPPMRVQFNNNKFHFSFPANWFVKNPLTDTALQEEVKQWKTIGVILQISKKSQLKSALKSL